MRLSANPIDSGYAEYLRQRPVLVYLDGVKVERCVMADDELGEVEYHKVDQHGQLILDHCDVVTEKKQGRVQIVPFGHAL